MSDHGQANPPANPPATPPVKGKGRPDLVGRALAATAGKPDKRAALHDAFDDDDRTNVRAVIEATLAVGGRPLDAVIATFGVDAGTADAMCRDAL